jgi:prepilin-type N-terminal cleavage/methylation domain-containing protein
MIKSQKLDRSGFTIVELLIVISVIGILTSISIIGYGAWRQSLAEREVRSDLNGVATAMENARNWGEGYPELEEGSVFSNGSSNAPIFISSENVTLTYAFGDINSFCVDAQNTTKPDVLYFLNVINGHQTIASGDCESFYAIAWKQISAGVYHTCAIASDDQVYCWGRNNDGQLGDNSTIDSSVPVAVDTSGALSGKTIKSISAGYYHTCAIASDDQAYCWGYNAYGALGNNSTTDSSVPVAVNTSGVLSSKNIISVSAGGAHTCAIASDNKAYCWGRNTYGRLGNNSTTDSSVPVAVYTSGVLSGKTITSVSAGGNHTCAIASDNQIYCWGYNYYGQLGNNSTTDSSVPVAVNTSGVLSGKTIMSVSNGSGNHTCAIASDNQIYCWGNNDYGQLGNNSTTNSSVPVAVYTSGVLSGKTTTSVSASGNDTCAIASDNQTYCWGYNYYGALGDNSTTNRRVPVAVYTSGVLSGKTTTSVSNGGDNHTCAIASDNQIYCWGNNDYGQLGNNSTTDSSVPVLVDVSSL